MDTQDYLNRIKPTRSIIPDYLGGWLFEHSGAYSKAVAKQTDEPALKSVKLLMLIAYNEGINPDPNHRPSNDYDVGRRVITAEKLKKRYLEIINAEKPDLGFDAMALIEEREENYKVALQVMSETLMLEEQGDIIILLENGVVFARTEPVGIPDDWSSRIADI